ncbi:phage tail tape measure protein [Janibacter indicus]|uniref:phage tail tape measure protein n=1 Tax=Janibacter indicus TaxID=857417 RepID=UPI003D9A520D
MTSQVIKTVLETDASKAVAGFKQAEKAVDDYHKALTRPSERQAWDDLSTKAMIGGAAVATGIGVAVDKFAEFDSAMSAVQANSGSTGAVLENLRKAAIDLGADTQFSATEAADGINELSKAGVGAKDILGGGLKGSLDLAAAGQIGVGEAAETAATAMTQFNLNGSEIPHVADLLTNAANKAQGGVGDLAAALKQGGLVAASTGLNIDETTASLAAFASAGLIGSDAGTSLKTMLQRLSAPTGESARLMEDLGISAYDASGEFVGMEALAGQLQTSLSGLTAQQRNSALATIFGSDAVRAANILYTEGAGGISKWTTEVTEQGAAAEQAATLTDNLKGDVERLGGAFDSAFIQTGSGSNDALRTLVQGLTGVVDHVSKVPGPVLLAGGALTTLALVGPKTVLAFRDLKGEAAAVGLSMDGIASRGPRAAEAMHGLDRGARAAAKGFAVLSAAKVTAETLQSDDLAVGVEKATERVIGANDAVAEMNKILEENAVKSFEADSTIRSLGDAADVAFNPSKMESFSKGNEAFWKGLTFGLVDVTTKTDEANEAFSQIDAQLAGLVQGGNADEANRLFKAYAVELGKSGVSTDEFKTKLPGFTEALAAAGNQSKLTGDDMAGMGDDAEEAEKQIDDLKNALEVLGGGFRAEQAAMRQVEESLKGVREVAKDGAGWNELSAAMESAAGDALMLL